MVMLASIMMKGIKLNNILFKEILSLKISKLPL